MSNCFSPGCTAFSDSAEIIAITITISAAAAAAIVVTNVFMTTTFMQVVIKSTDTWEAVMQKPQMELP